MDHRQSEVRGNILQLNLNILRTQSIMLTTMLRKKILMIKELYKTENMCFCHQSIFIQLVHVFNQSEANWLEMVAKKIKKMYINDQTHKLLINKFNLFVATFSFEFILCFFHSESSLSFILCYTSSARFVRLCRIYRICDTCFCCLCPCITTCF